MAMAIYSRSVHNDINAGTSAARGLKARCFAVVRRHKGKLAVVTQSIIISRILYTALSGFLSAETINRINAFLKRFKRFGYIECSVTIEDLISKSDYELFIKMCLLGHLLYHLLPPMRISKLRNEYILFRCLITL